MEDWMSPTVRRGSQALARRISPWMLRLIASTSWAVMLLTTWRCFAGPGHLGLLALTFSRYGKWSRSILASVVMHRIYACMVFLFGSFWRKMSQRSISRISAAFWRKVLSLRVLQKCTQRCMLQSVQTLLFKRQRRRLLLRKRRECYHLQFDFPEQVLSNMECCYACGTSMT